MTQTVAGQCAPGWQAVADAFGQLLQSGPQGGALTIFHQGECVLDLWGGPADRAGERPWQRDTVVNLFSAGKAVLAVMMADCLQGAGLSPDTRVASLWPGFGAEGKDTITLRQVLSHTAGVCAFAPPVPEQDIHDWEAMVRHVERAAPAWAPGSRLGYAPFLTGWLLGEVVRRLTGQRPGDWLRERWGHWLERELLLGLSEAELPRVADLAPLPGAQPPADGGLLARARTSELARRAFTLPPSLMTGTNSRPWRQAQIPAANLHGSARALARLYAGVLAPGGTPLPPGLAGWLGAEQARGPCEVTGLRLRTGLGVLLGTPDEPHAFGLPATAFGHPGAGGSVVFADPARQLSFAFVTSRLGQEMLLDARVRSIMRHVPCYARA